MPSTATRRETQAQTNAMPPREPRFFKRVENFMERVTEGMEIDQLWLQLRQDAKSGFQLYTREIDFKPASQRSPRDWFQVVRSFFWAVVMKLSPSKRVVLIIGLILLLLPWSSVNGAAWFHIYGGLIMFGLLVLEVADRVTMKRDLQIAREIQSWLVPSQPPKIAGLASAFFTKPANTVAGDYYDVFYRDVPDVRNNVLIAVADVAGKSVPAALLMATFQASLKTLSATRSSVVGLTSGMNRYACKHSMAGARFTTAFLAEYDPDSRHLTYVNAGHNAPMLRRGSGVIERLDVGGVPLGILSDCAYESAEMDLSPGDTLLIFTDGVVEAENDRSDEYGEERLISVFNANASLSADEIIQAIMRDVLAFTGTAPQHDDITCLIAKFE
jgi:sigma-B regulation protein RsbU (phosphoserine phosphatase)